MFSTNIHETYWVDGFHIAEGPENSPGNASQPQSNDLGLFGSFLLSLRHISLTLAICLNLYIRALLAER